MRTENKRSWMIWAIVVLAVMNLSTLGTILYHQYQSEKPAVNPDEAQKQLETDAEKFSGRYFRDKLNLDGSQMEQFRAINPVFRQQARAITVELASMRKQMLVELASSNSDTTKLNALSDAIGQLHSQLKKITYQYYLDMKGICNTEQQKLLSQLFSEMFTNDSSMSFPGKGGRGPQHGKHMNNN